MPLTKKGSKILASMRKTYGSDAKAKSAMYASKNAGKISGIDSKGGSRHSPYRTPSAQASCKLFKD